MGIKISQCAHKTKQIFFSQKLTSIEMSYKLREWVITFHSQFYHRKKVPQTVFQEIKEDCVHLKPIRESKNVFICTSVYYDHLI